MRAMSLGLFRSSRTTEASNPECMAQFRQRSSFRDSQYSQSVPYQKSCQVSVYCSAIR